MSANTGLLAALSEKGIAGEVTTTSVPYPGIPEEEEEGVLIQTAGGLSVRIRSACRTDLRPSPFLAIQYCKQCEDMLPPRIFKTFDELTKWAKGPLEEVDNVQRCRRCQNRT